MKINYMALEQITEALRRMSNLTGKVGYAIMRNQVKLEPELKIYSSLRANLIKKYAPDGADGIKPEDPGFQDFLKEYNDFLQTEFDADIYQISAEDYDLDAVYCETARASDYKLIEALIVRRDGSDGAPEPVSSGDAEKASEG